MRLNAVKAVPEIASVGLASGLAYWRNRHGHLATRLLLTTGLAAGVSMFVFPAERDRCASRISEQIPSEAHDRIQAIRDRYHSSIVLPVTRLWDKTDRAINKLVQRLV